MSGYILCHHSQGDDEQAIYKWLPQLIFANYVEVCILWRFFKVEDYNRNASSYSSFNLKHSVIQQK